METPQTPAYSRHKRRWTPGSVCVWTGCTCCFLWATSSGGLRGKRLLCCIIRYDPSPQLSGPFPNRCLPAALAQRALRSVHRCFSPPSDIPLVMGPFSPENILWSSHPCKAGTLWLSFREFGWTLHRPRQPWPLTGRKDGHKPAEQIRLTGQPRGWLRVERALSHAGETAHLLVIKGSRGVVRSPLNQDHAHI